ncbi:MAG TPA: histidine kinase N-terminal domain-containing protein [Acidimicrobiales bacterium]|nr:histidine kinase N-terminal domain-containing protein [Acidimicrobiales bacterium]
MTTPAEIAARHTDLDGAGFAHLQRVLGAWGILADLSFSDLLLLVPTDQKHEEFVVLGQIRPTTGATLLRVDLVGQLVRADDWPALGEAVEGNGIVTGSGTVPLLAHSRWGLVEVVDATDTGEMPAVPDTAQLEYVPVNDGGRVVAVIVRVGTLEDRRRRAGRLERVYRDIYQRLAEMVVVGEYPYAQEEISAEDAPRVGDGLIMVDVEGRVEYASPNAMSALHRMGVNESVEHRFFAELGIEEMAIEHALVTGCPVIEEVERRPDVIVLLHCTPLLHRRRVTGALVLMRDVTDLRRLNRLLLSKDAAIREVHHRVKNNLQTISSLLRLQARRLEPGQGQEALREAERRVRSIALVHEILSREPGDEVPFDEIVSSLVVMAADSVVSDHPVEIRVTGDLGEVDAGVATPLAVVIAEVLQNAVEHAFPDGSGAGGHVELVLAHTDERLTVQVRDDGCGLPDGFDIERTKSLGLSIVRDLVTSQLDGTIAMESRDGTLVAIEIPRHPLEGE